MTGGPEHATVTVTAQNGSAAADTVVYTAQLECTDGRYTLVVTDRVRGIKHVAAVSKKAVDKLPMYLDMLKQAPRSR